jgi:DNA-binding CsgD family transcriptional regulator/tetratricopeptide (TPR) repeat protein
MIRPVRPDGTIETGGVFVPVLRRRVIDRIASAALQRIVLIVAPAGYGKSVALRQYLETIDEPVIRFDVLTEHATLLGFLRGLADALVEVAPDARSTLAGAYEKNAASHTPGSDLALWMHSHLKSFRGVIALDDLHVAQEDRDVTQFLTALIERSKGRIQWVIASRATLGLPIGTWLAYGESDLAIDEHDLKFTVEEAKDAARSFRLGVRDEELYELLHLTDGWPTAMSFALRSSTRSIDLRNISSMTREMIYRYLAEQVYTGLGDVERGFIETVALLDEFDAPLMVATGFDRAAGMIDDLRQRVAFVHEQHPGVYRLHDLFRDFVRHQLTLRGESAVRERSNAVAAVLESLGRAVPALRLYAGAGNTGAVLRLLSERGLDLLSRGFADDVASVMQMMPESVASDAVFRALAGLVEMQRGRLRDGEQMLRASVRAVADPALRGEFLLRLAVYQSNSGGDPSPLLEQMIDDPSFPEIKRVEAKSLLASMYAARGSEDAARRILSDVVASLDAVDDEDVRAAVLLRLGSTYHALKEFARAKEALSAALELASRRSLWAVASRANQSLANLVLWHDSDTASSLWHAQQSSVSATRAGDYLDVQRSLLMMLSLETRRGNAERVAQVERQLVDLSKNDASISSFLVSSQAHRAAWAGRFGDAARLFSSIRGRQPFSIDRAFVFAVLALCGALDGNREKTLNEEAIEQLSASRDELSVVWCIGMVFAVLTEIVNGRLTAAQRLLSRCAPGPSEVVTCAVTAAAELAKYAKSGSHQLDDFEGHVEALETFGFGGYARYFRLALEAISAAQAPEQIVKLTPSEQQVLSALARGMTPKDIAAESGRSVLTVQTHVQNVIKKLGGHGRAEAIAAAKRMGLL